MKKIGLFLLFLLILGVAYSRMFIHDWIGNWIYFTYWADTAIFSVFFSMLNVLFLYIFKNSYLKEAIIGFTILPILVFLVTIFYKINGNSFLYELSEDLITVYFSPFPLFLFFIYQKIRHKIYISN